MPIKRRKLPLSFWLLVLAAILIAALLLIATLWENRDRLRVFFPEKKASIEKAQAVEAVSENRPVEQTPEHEPAKGCKTEPFEVRIPA